MLFMQFAFQPLTYNSLPFGISFNLTTSFHVNTSRMAVIDKVTKANLIPVFSPSIYSSSMEIQNPFSKGLKNMALYLIT